jgi:drug/metabolite transporter (DMT)-like permease
VFKLKVSRGIGSLLIASVSFGSSAIFIRFATEVSAVSLTFYRLSIAALVMILFALLSHSMTRLCKRDLGLVIASGFTLSFHFATFIFAVQGTTVANATFLVNTSPVMLAVLSPRIIKEKTTSRELVGVVLATLGVLLVAYAGNGFQTFGLADLSALSAAFLITLYSLIGRRARTQGLTTGSYTSYVYSVAALVSLFLALAFGSRVFRSYDTQSILAILCLALVPTALGHSLYNYALGSVKTVTANLVPLLEPVLASLLAILLFNEVPTLVQVIGYSLIVAAVVAVIAKRLADRPVDAELN